MKGSLDISVSSPLWRGLPRARAIARETIAAAAAESGRPSEGGDVSLCLADDAALRELNLRWRGIDKPTNVLSFPAAPPGRLRERNDAWRYRARLRDARARGRGPRRLLSPTTIATSSPMDFCTSSATIMRRTRRRSAWRRSKQEFWRGSGRATLTRAKLLADDRDE